MDLILGLSHNQGGSSIMQVIVSCPLIVPDEPIDSNALEAHAPACPRCQQPTTLADGSRPYALRTLFGTVRLARQRRRCRACGRIFQPLDPLLGAGSGRATTGLRQAAMLAAASWPFATAVWLLHALSGAEVSAEWVRQVAKAAGQVAAETASQAATALVVGERRVEPPTVPAQGLIALDGGYVQSHDNPAGAVLATGRERVGRERWRLTGRRYVASFGSAATFGPLVYQVAAAAGMAQAALLGDGAGWHYPRAERRLDLWHLLRRGHEALLAEELPEAEAQALWVELAGRLRRGEVEPARELVQQHLRGPAGGGFAGYLASQREWIVDAEMLLAQGEIVGSGAIEKGVDLVLNRRFKGRRGMGWGRAKANAIVTLRTHILNRQAEAA
jgi:transposase